MLKLHAQKSSALIFTFLICGSSSAHSGATSKTFFSATPQYSTGSPEHISFYRTDRMIACMDSFEASFQAVVFGSGSTNADELARYFFPDHKKYLMVAEGPNTVPDPLSTPPNEFVGGAQAFKDNTYDLIARNFNIETVDHNFQSIVSLQPEQTSVGCALNYRQNLSFCLRRGFWFDITIPIVRVRNSVNLEEHVITSGTPLPGTAHNMTEAFLNRQWEYGKISPCGLEKKGIADMEIRVGYDVMRTCISSLGGYLGCIIPTGNRPHGEFLFEPIIGRNRHWGLIWGGAATFFLWENDEDTAHMYLNIESNNNYLFESTERRLLDLRNKPWSRYINIFDSASATHTSPGINLLTQDLKISPHGLFQFNTALTTDWSENFMFEAGVHSLMRNAEDGYPVCQWQESAAIAGAAAANPELQKNSADSMSNANMHSWNYELIAPDADLAHLHASTADNTLIFRPIREQDLDIQSALHPFYCAFTCYGTLGYQDMDTEFPWFAAIGGGYQFGPDNSAMHRWTLWGKVSVSV